MYSEIEALALTKLQSVTGFSSTNTSRGNWGILNSGLSDHYGVLKPGAFTRSQGAMNMNVSLFDVVIQVWQQYVDDGSSLTNLEGYVKAVLNYFDKYPRLGDATNTVIDAFITAGRETQERWSKDGALVWLSQDLILTVQEHDEVTYA